jgi:N-acetylmuramoyl-L-alanine amidase
MSTLDTTTINSYLQAKNTNSAFQQVVSDTQTKANEAKVINNATVLGQDVLQNVNGYISLENNVTLSTDPDNLSSVTFTAGSMVQISPGAEAYPIAGNSSTLYVTDETGTTYTVHDSVSAILGFVQDSAGGEPILDSAGNFVTEIIGSTTTQVVTQISDGIKQNVPEVLESLTGMKAPDESITIVALGGAAVNELTNTIQVASERKSSLLGQINTVAGAAGGLGADATASANSLLSDLDAVADQTSSLTQSVMGAVSAVEGIANEVAEGVANEIGSLVQGISTTIGQATTAINDGFGDLLGAVENATESLLDNVLPDIETGFGFAQNLFEELTGDIGSTLQGIFGDATDLDNDLISSVIKDVLNGGDIELTNATKNLALQDKSLNQRMKTVISTTNADNPADFNARVVSRARAQGIDETQITAYQKTSSNIETALSKVDTTIAGKIVSEVGEFYKEDTDLAELVKRYLGSDTESFEYVDSKEELGLEFVKMTRPISEVIVHGTETYTNANIGSEEIHLRHNEAGHNGIQYHYVIRRDGRLQRGMPLDEISAASDVLGHSLNCIDVALVGGVNVPTEDDNALSNLSAQSFTQAQMKTLEALLEIFYQRVPGGQVMGHNAIDANTEDPYFDVIAFVENKFGKKSVYKDPLTEQALPIKDLVGTRPATLQVTGGNTLAESTQELKGDLYDGFSRRDARLTPGNNYRLSIPLDVISNSSAGGRFTITNNMPGLQTWRGVSFRVWMSESRFGSPMSYAGRTFEGSSGDPNPATFRWSQDNSKLGSNTWYLGTTTKKVYLNFEIVGNYDGYEYQGQTYNDYVFNVRNNPEN